MADLLEVKNLTKRFDNTTKSALENFSYSLPAGKIVALVGESGSGKSTLLNIIAGNLSPDSGSVVLKGKTLSDPKDLLIKGHDGMRIVKQDFELFPRKTAYENITYPLRRYQKDYQVERADELVRLCKLDAVKDQLAMNLSGGQKQRVAIACAIADDTDILLMDEPFNQIDHHLKHALKDEILNLVSDLQLGAMIITHDPGDALSLADEIIILKSGKIVNQGSPQQLYHCPGDLYTARLLGPISTFTAEQVKLFFHQDIEHQLIAVRPESFIIGRGTPFQVKQRQFLGPHCISTLTREDHTFMVSHPGDKEFMQAELSVSINLDRICPID